MVWIVKNVHQDRVACGSSRQEERFVQEKMYAGNTTGMEPGHLAEQSLFQVTFIVVVGIGIVRWRQIPHRDGAVPTPDGQGRNPIPQRRGVGPKGQGGNGR